MPTPPTTTFLFAGGGTGGHLYPGLAIAHALRTLAPDSTHALFLCSDRAIDARILTQERADFRPVPARPFSIRPRPLVRFLSSWGKTVRLGRTAIRDARARGRNVHLVALGGFVAAPLVQAAIVERIPITMLNLDAIPGKANRWIARRIRAASPRDARAPRIFTTLPIPPSHAYAADWTVIPPIVRPAAVATASPAESRRRLGLHPERPTLMVTGGSLGASSINRLLLDLARSTPHILSGWQILHQTGDKTDDSLTQSLQAAYAAAGTDALVTPFVADIGLWWGAADLAVSRAGAGAVAEAWANRVPTLFLPYPHHKDQHQRYNAAPLEQAGGAVIATDHIDPAANLAHTAPTLASLLQDHSRRTSMRTALTRLAPANGADHVARILLEKTT